MGSNSMGVRISLVEEIDPATGLIVLFAERSEMDRLDTLIELSKKGALRGIRELKRQSN